VHPVDIPAFSHDATGFPTFWQQNCCFFYDVKRKALKPLKHQIEININFKIKVKAKVKVEAKESTAIAQRSPKRSPST
jgi:hypothetical protein